MINLAKHRSRSGGTILDNLPPRGKTRRQAAAMLGVSYDTMVRWHHNEEFVPAGPHEQRGGVTIFMYSDEQIQSKINERTAK
jgi:hypothetical protein